MKNVWMVVCGLAALSASSSIALASGGMSFSFAMKGDAFALDLKMVFDGSQSLADVRKVMKDTALFSRLSDFVSNVSQSGPDSGYYLAVSAKKFGLTQTNVGKCADSDSDTEFKQDCVLAMNKGNTSRYWVWGRNSIHCAAGSPVVCVVHVEGQPKGVSIPFIFERTAQQLAIAGASQSVRDYGVMLLYVNQGLSPGQAQLAFPSSTLGGLQGRIYGEARAKADAGLGSSTLYISGSDLTGAYSLTVK